MKFRNLLLIILFAAPFAFGQLFTRIGELPLPSGEAGFGNMVAGADIDGDGKAEIYLVNDDWNDGTTGDTGELIPSIYKYEYDGALGWNLVWQATLAPEVVLQNTWPALTIGDLDKDGRPELIWGPVNFSPYLSHHPRVIVYEYAGDGSDNFGIQSGANWLPNSKWSIDTTAGVNLRPFTWMVGDPDGDNTNELVFTNRAGSFLFGVASVSDIPNNGDGSETWTLEYRDSTAANYSDITMIDNQVNIFNTNGTVYGFRYQTGAWTKLPTQAGLVPGGGWRSASVVDIDGNLSKEIVLAANGSSNRNVYLVQQSGDTLIATAIADFGTLAGAGGRLYGGSAGDIDLNGKLDFAFGTRDAVPDNASIYRLEYLGGDITLPASYAQSVIDKGYVTPLFGTGRWMHIAITNVDGDPRAEVLYGDGTGEHAPIIILDSEGQVPVELTSFAASVADGFVNLTWSTATESNNKGYEVQRKSGNSDFVTVGFVLGKGTTTESQSYSFVDNNVQAGTYQYRLKQIDLDGSYSLSNVVEVSIVSPIEYNLAQNYPNPFNPSTTINFSLAKESNVNLRVFDLLGQEILSLVNNEFMAAGSYSYKFDASSLASGTYIYRLEAGNFVQTKKMTLTK